MYNLRPELNSDGQARLLRWLQQILASDGLSSTTTPELNLGSYFAIYDSTGRSRHVSFGGYWTITADVIQLAQENVARNTGLVTPAQRLEILISLAGLLSPEAQEGLRTYLQNSITRVLLGQYKAMTDATLIKSETPVVRLAFNVEQAQVAAYIDGKYYLPGNGLEVKVNPEEGWTECGLQQ